MKKLMGRNSDLYHVFFCRQIMVKVDFGDHSVSTASTMQWQQEKKVIAKSTRGTTTEERKQRHDVYY